jgi:probable rRNA maturation factor
MVVIDVQDLQEGLPIESLPLGEWAAQVLELLKITEAELSVVVVDNAQIQELNKTYLEHDRPTNVISFPQQEGDGPADNNHLGDVVISIERASEEAAEAGMRLDERMLQLLIHGICHLLGYDHERGTDEQASQMEEVEESLFKHILGEQPGD